MTKLSAAPPREKSVNTNNYDFPALSSLFFGQEQWWVGCPRRAAADCTLTYDDDGDDDDDDHDDDHDIEGNEDENIVNGGDDDKKKIVPLWFSSTSNQLTSSHNVQI